MYNICLKYTIHPVLCDIWEELESGLGLRKMEYKVGCLSALVPPVGGQAEMTRLLNHVLKFISAELILVRSCKLRTADDIMRMISELTVVGVGL